MDITADDLCRDVKFRLIQEEISEYLRSIKDNIQQAHDTNKSSTVYDLPVVFNVENMDIKDTQLMVYGGIIEELERKGFKTTIELGEDVAKLYIKWSSTLSAGEKERLNRIISSHLAKKKK